MKMCRSSYALSGDLQNFATSEYKLATVILQLSPPFRFHKVGTSPVLFSSPVSVSVIARTSDTLDPLV